MHQPCAPLWGSFRHARTLLFIAALPCRRAGVLGSGAATTALKHVVQQQQPRWMCSGNARPRGGWDIDAYSDDANRAGRSARGERPARSPRSDRPAPRDNYNDRRQNTGPERRSQRYGRNNDAVDSNYYHRDARPDGNNAGERGRGAGYRQRPNQWDADNQTSSRSRRESNGPVYAPRYGRDRGSAFESGTYQTARGRDNDDYDNKANHRFAEGRRDRSQFDDSRRDRSQFDDSRRDRSQFDDSRRDRSQFDDSRRYSSTGRQPAYSRGVGRADAGGREYGRDRSGPSELQLALASETHDLIYGVSPVLAALRAGRRECVTLYVQKDRYSASDTESGLNSAGSKYFDETRTMPSSTVSPRTSQGPSRKPGHESAIHEIMSLVDVLGVEVRNLNKGDLNVLSRDRPHQGFVLRATNLDYEQISTLGPPPVSGQTSSSGETQDEESSENASIDEDIDSRDGASAQSEAGPVWLVLDEVTDPQNFGALVRSAHFLGAEGVIACRRNSSPLTAVVSKASSGALEVMHVRGVTSMPRFLHSAAAEGWRVVGTALGQDAVSARTLTRGPPTLLVLGSEGRGLRPLVQEACNLLVRIDGKTTQAPDGLVVDSLNVSVAGAIALHQLLGQ